MPVIVSGEDHSLAQALLAALGGKANLRSVEGAANRILVGHVDAGRVDGAALAGLGVRGVAASGAGGSQLVLGQSAAGPAAALAALIKA